MNRVTLHARPVSPELVTLLCDADLAHAYDIAALRTQTLIETQWPTA